MHRTTIFLFAAAILTAPVPAITQPLAGDNHSAGRQVAMELCSSCHQVIEGQHFPRQNAASFFDIANISSTTALSLKVFLRSNHKGMPNLIVSDRDADDLIDYILSLKRR